MRKYSCRLYVGPTLVKPLAAKLRTAGLNVTIEGVVHVYFEFEASGDMDEVKASLLRRLNVSGLGFRDIWLMPKSGNGGNSDEL